MNERKDFKIDYILHEQAALKFWFKNVTDSDIAN